jgi:uncharacterized membrane protein
MHLLAPASGSCCAKEAQMIFKIVLGIAIAIVAVVSIPSVIATLMLLMKSIGALDQRRQRRAFLAQR